MFSLSLFILNIMNMVNPYGFEASLQDVEGVCDFMFRPVINILLRAYIFMRCHRALCGHKSLATERFVVT